MQRRADSRIAAVLLTELTGCTSVVNIGAGTGSFEPTDRQVVPLDCTDGFIEAYYGRPEAFLDPTVRRSQSAWQFVGAETSDRAVARLHADLVSGEWDRRHGTLRALSEFDGSLRLVTGRPS